MRIIKFILCYVAVKYLCRYRKFREKYIAYLYFREIEKQRAFSMLFKNKIKYKCLI
jgi:hypothetical protein